MGCCRLLVLKNQKPRPISKKTNTATPTPIPIAVPVSRCVVASALKLPAGAKGAAGTLLVHLPLEQTPLSAQSLLAEQVSLTAVGVVRVLEAVALGIGVAVSSWRENARREMVDIMIREVK
jgi:hypothetical protein